MTDPPVPPRRKNNRPYEVFCKATKRLCSDLGIDYNQVKIDKLERTNRSFYNAYGYGCKYPLVFRVFLDKVKSLAWPMLTVSIDIPYGEGSLPFSFSEDVPESKMRGGYLVRCVEYAVHKFRLEHEPANLNSLFAGANIRVYGIDWNPDLTQAEMKIFTNGIKKTPNDLVTVYEFRHIDHDTRYRSFSYGFSVALRGLGEPLWVFFHGVGSTSPEGIDRYLKPIETMVKSIRSSVKKRFDVEYDTLHKYLQEHAVSFEPRRSGEMLFDLNKVPTEKLKKEFRESYSKFLRHLASGDYPEALRSVRVLVQHMLEDVCRENGIDMPRRPGISNLGQVMRNNGIIDAKIEALLGAFTPYPNEAAHKLLSQEYTSSSLTRRMIETTILLGAQLIIYMAESVKHGKTP